ncbi:STAS domain-containing protein [Kineococcus sp. NBC_00420]|uniref:STAS domain-containing protein n=1 Tax=Kineococcus sp. NBC_00420 TaxID=2903564 RepID=UPI002E1FBE97
MLPPLVLTSPGGDEQAPVLTCSVAVDTTMSVVHLVGELDIDTSGLLAAVVAGQIERGHVDLRLDLSGVRFCDLAGLYALRAALRDLQEAGGRLRLLRPSPFLLRVVGLCGLQDLLDTMAAAEIGCAVDRPQDGAGGSR